MTLVPGSVVRSVTVNFRAGGVGKYVADVETMGAATRQAFDGTSRSTKEADRSLDGLDRTAKRTAADTDRLARSTRQAGQEADNSGRAFRRQSAEIDRTSGRMRVLRDSIITLGPAAIPIGATLLPAVTGLAAGFGAAAGAAGILVLATHGVGDALKAMDAYQVQPTAANLEKLNVAMAKLGPSGREFVTYLDQIEPHLRNLQQLSEAGVLPGAEAGIQHLLTLLPQVRQVIGSLSQEVGKELDAAGQHLSSDGEFQHFLQYLKTDGAPTMHAFAAATGDVIAGLTQLFVDMAPANRSFSQGLLKDAEAFRRWSDSVGQTQGFRDFLNYIQTEGPRVAQFLGALASALLGILQAAAPLGSAVLPVLTELLRLLAAIGQSPIGPVIYTGVAAVIAFNRAGTAMDGLLKKLGVSTSALSAEMKGLAASTAAVDASAAGGAAAAARGGALNDLKLVGSGALISRTTAMTAGAMSEREAARLAAATTAGAAARARLLGPLGRPAGALGTGLALYGSGYLSNQGYNALGNLLAPGQRNLGTTANIDAIVNSIRNSSGFKGFAGGYVADPAKLIGFNPDQIGNKGPYKSADQGLAQLVGSGQGVKADEIFAKISSRVKDAAKYFPAYTAAVNAAKAANGGLSAAQADSAQKALQQAAALKASTDAVSAAFDAETNLRQALSAAADQAKKSNAGINGNTAEVIANRQQLSNLRDAWKQQIEAMAANGASMDKIKGRYAAFRDQFINLATGMGVPIGQARRLAQSMLEVPKSVTSTVTVNTSLALAGIDLVKGALANLHGKTLDVYINRIDTSGAGNAQQNAQHSGRAPGSADGTTVPDDGGPYSDRFLYRLAPREEVVSDRFGGASKNRAALKAASLGARLQVVPGLAGGGTVGSHVMAGTGQTIYTLPFGSHVRWTAAEDYAKAAKALDKITDRVNHMTTALSGAGGLNDALQAMQSKADSLSSSVQSGLQRDLFSGSSGSAFGQAYAAGSPGYAIGQLQGEKQDETDYASLIAQVQAKGITGDALAAILADGGISALRQFAAADIGTDQQYASLYTSVRGPQGTLAAATSSALAATGDTAQLQALNDKVDALTKQLDKASKEQSKAKARADKEKTDLMKSAPHQQAQAGKAVLDHAGQRVHRNTKKGPKRG